MQRFHSHYFDKEYMEQACEYNGVDIYPAERRHYGNTQRWEVDRFSLTNFLYKLHRTNPQTFALLMSYILKDIFIHQGDPQSWVNDDKIYFEDFKRDLRAVGYQLDGTNLMPIVGYGEKEEMRLVDELDGLLRNINPKFPSMREGAWEAYLSGTPDSDRQAISSIRELLSHVVDSLSSKKTWKERVADIAGGADAEVVSSLAELVEKLYRFQSKGTHDEPSYERAFFAIKATEYAIHFLLKSALNEQG